VETRRPAAPTPGQVEWAAQIRDYAILTLDPDGVVTSWNAGAELVKGYAAEEILGRSFEVFYPESDRTDGLPGRLLEQARRDGRVEHIGWRVRRDGSQFWGDVVITAVTDSEGAFAGFIKVTRDLTEEHRLEQAREMFLAGVGHDFRSPLTSIEGYAGLLKAEIDDPMLADFAERIQSNALRLMKLVDLMLEHSRLRAGRVRVTPAPTRVDALLGAVVDELGTQLDGHVVTLHVAHEVVQADATAMSRVFTNLLTNAAKYSPAGSGIDLHVDVVAEGFVDIVVADRGRGIDPEDLATIFDEFERGRRAEDDGGFGLGLSVVRHLVEMHGGTVTLGPGRYGGTDVTVRLPAAAMEPTPV